MAAPLAASTAHGGPTATTAPAQVTVLWQALPSAFAICGFPPERSAGFPARRRWRIGCKRLILRAPG